MSKKSVHFFQACFCSQHPHGIWVKALIFQTIYSIGRFCHSNIFKSFYNRREILICKSSFCQLIKVYRWSKLIDIDIYNSQSCFLKSLEIKQVWLAMGDSATKSYWKQKKVQKKCREFSKTSMCMAYSWDPQTMLERWLVVHIQSSQIC